MTFYEPELLQIVLTSNQRSWQKSADKTKSTQVCTKEELKVHGQIKTAS
jgi:hypothetical protein